MSEEQVTIRLAENGFAFVYTVVGNGRTESRLVELEEFAPPEYHGGSEALD